MPRSKKTVAPRSMLADRPRVNLSDFDHSIYFLIAIKQAMHFDQGSSTFWMDFVLKEDDVADRIPDEITFNGARYGIARVVGEGRVEYMFINTTTREYCRVDKDMHIRMM
jgi:hypothetical protein